MSASWEETLEVLATRAGSWREVAGGRTAPGDLQWPEADLPPHLLARARELLSGYRRAEEAVAARRDELRSAIEVRRAARPARRPLYLDRHV